MGLSGTPSLGRRKAPPWTARPRFAKAPMLAWTRSAWTHSVPIRTVLVGGAMTGPTMAATCRPLPFRRLEASSQELLHLAPRRLQSLLNHCRHCFPPLQGVGGRLLARPLPGVKKIMLWRLLPSSRRPHPPPQQAETMLLLLRCLLPFLGWLLGGGPLTPLLPLLEVASRFRFRAPWILMVTLLRLCPLLSRLSSFPPRAAGGRMMLLFRLPPLPPREAGVKRSVCTPWLVLALLPVMARQ